MSNFSSEQESSDGGVRRIWTGIENFKVRSVCPDLDELQKLYGENAKEETYVGVNKVDDKEYPQVRVTIHCDNAPEEGEDKVTARPTFWISALNVESKEKGTKQYINAFGKTCWLSDDDAAKKLDIYEIKGANGTYRWHGEKMRPALRGEAEFIEFVRALLNLNDDFDFKSGKSNPDRMKTALSMFSMEDWKKVFDGNFTALKKAVETSNNKVGLLLGAKKADEGKVYQDVFTRCSLRQYTKNTRKYSWILKQLDNAVNNGGFPNTDWGPRDLILREYASDAVPTAGGDIAPKEDIKKASSAFFDSAAAAGFEKKS